MLMIPTEKTSIKVYSYNTEHSIYLGDRKGRTIPLPLQRRNRKTFSLYVYRFINTEPHLFYGRDNFHALKASLHKIKGNQMLLLNLS